MWPIILKAAIIYYALCITIYIRTHSRFVKEYEVKFDIQDTIGIFWGHTTTCFMNPKIPYHFFVSYEEFYNNYVLEWIEDDTDSEE